MSPLTQGLNYRSACDTKPVLANDGLMSQISQWVLGVGIRLKANFNRNTNSNTE